MLTIRNRWVVSIVTMAGVLAIALASTTLASARNSPRVQSFQAELLTSSAITNEDCVFRGGGSNICDFEVTGDIIGTHLGFGSVEASFSFDVGGILSGGCGQIVPNSGRAVWTSFTGDELHLNPVSSFNCASGVNGTSVTGVHEIVGGTGQFRRASGSLSFLGQPTEDGLTNRVVGEIRLRRGAIDRDD